MFRLKLFGTASLEGAAGPVKGRAAQGRRMALLAMLALARGRTITRDRLIAVLLPESSPERARHQLSDDVYIVRGGLGEDAVRSVGDELALNADAVAADVEEFQRLLDSGDAAGAVALYAGPLMDGFHFLDGGEFQRWLEGERTRLSERYAVALETLAEAAEARGEHVVAARWWRTRAVHDPYCGRVALRLMRALEHAGDRAGAIRHARIHATLLKEEFDAEADTEVTTLAERLRVASTPVAAAMLDAVRSPASVAMAAAGREAPLGTTTAMGAASRDPGADRHPVDDLVPVPQHPAERWSTARPRRVLYVTAAVALLVLTAIGLQARPFPVEPPSAASTRLATSVGVLPFVNMSAEPDNAYFSDGLSEQIIAELSRIEGLHVAARTSSFALRNERLDVRAIGDTLGVAAVLEGSVRRDGHRLRVTAQLIDASTGYHLWTGEYARELADIFAVQEEIAQAIALALELQLAPSRPARVARGPASMEAYDHYLRGLYLRNNLTGDALRRASDHFDQAIARDSTFALAYAAKASVVAPATLFGHIDRAEGTREFRALTARALELDPGLGEAHVALGILKLFLDWDWPGAEQALRRAVALNPNDAHAFHHLGNYLRAMGRLEEAAAARARAVELDPLNARTIIVHANDYYVLGDHARALEQFARARQLDPVHPLALGSGPWLPASSAQVYLVQGREPEAVEDLVRIATLRGATSSELAALRDGYASGGMPAFWRAWRAMDTRQSHGRMDVMRLAALSVRIGDTSAALDWLERAHAEKHMGLIFLNTDPLYAGLRAQPRFARLVQLMKFPPRGG